MKKQILLGLISIFMIGYLQAQPGTIDLSFDPGAGLNSSVQSLVIQPDGKIIVSGWFTSYDGTAVNRIVRINADGSIDTGFNIGSGFNGQVNSTPVQADGKIIVGGNFTYFNGIARNRIARLNSDGSIDTTFNPGSGFTDDVWTTNIQADGKIIVGGFFSSFNGNSRKSIARLNTDGSLDLSFNPGTGFNNVVNATAIQDDGKILAGGNFNLFNGTTVKYLARLNIDGTLDTSCSTSGVGFNSGVGFINIQNDGKVILTGTFSAYDGIARNKIARLNIDCTLDTTFNPGTGFNSFVMCTALQTDGKIIVGGLYNFYNGFSNNSIVRLNANGSRDTSFVSGSGFVNSVRWVAIQPDGKILAGGDFTSYDGVLKNRIIRINNDLSVGIVTPFKVIDFKCYPNPNNGILFMETNSYAQIKITNIQGQVVISQLITEGIHSVNLDNFNKGIYFVQAIEENNIISNTKIIVQ